MNMADMFGKMQEMQERMAQSQAALAEKSIRAEVGGGMVVVEANGLGRITSVKVEKEVVQPDDVEMLEDLIVSGVNKALDEAEQLRQDEMRRSASSMLPPGLDMSRLGL